MASTKVSNKEIVCKLTINIPNKTILSLDLQNNATIQTVKERIQKIKGIDIEQQSLYYNGICLDNQCRVLSFNDCTLHLQQNGMTISVLLGSSEYFMNRDKMIQLHVSSNATIQILKQKIYEKEGFPVECQIISLQKSTDFYLDDDVLLSQCDINTNSPFMLFINYPKDQRKTKRYGVHKKKRKNRGNYRRNNRKQQNKNKSITKQQNKRKNVEQHNNKEKHENQTKLQNKTKGILDVLDAFSDITKKEKEYDANLATKSEKEMEEDNKQCEEELDSSNFLDHCIIDSVWEQESNILYDKAEKEYNRILDLYQFQILIKQRMYIKKRFTQTRKLLNFKDDEEINQLMLKQICYEIGSLKQLDLIYKHYKHIMTVNNNENRNKLKDEIKKQIKRVKEREENLLEVVDSKKYANLQNKATSIHILEIETECKQNIMMSTKDQCKIYKQYIQNLEQLFIYNHDFDENGIVYAIGTGFGEKPWHIPCDKIDVHLSSKYDKSEYEEYRILDRLPVCCITKPERNPWIIIDFTPKMIKPTHYSLRYISGSFNIEALKYWIFEGSNDNGKTWKLLSKHENDKSLYSKKGTATWTLSNYHNYHTLNVLNEFYTHFRILQTNIDSNNNGLSSMICSGFEIYGIVKDMDHSKTSNDVNNNFDDLLIDRIREKYRNLVMVHHETEFIVKLSETERNILSMKYDDLRIQVKTQKDMIQSITTQKTQIEEKYIDLDTKYNNLQLKYESVQKSKDELNDKYNASEKIKEELMSNITTLNNKYNESEKSNRKIIEKHDKLKQKYNGKKNRNSNITKTNKTITI